MTVSIDFHSVGTTTDVGTATTDVGTTTNDVGTATTAYIEDFNTDTFFSKPYDQKLI